VVSGGAKSRQAAEEAFYGFGDFFRDLDKDRCLPECLMHELKALLCREILLQYNFMGSGLNGMLGPADQ